MESRRALWNRIHAVSDPDALSGSDPDNVLDHHGLTGYLRPGMRVLDIGVGLGKNVRHFVEARGCIVDALDVADEAERHVRPWARKFYLADDAAQLPRGRYDLALSHLTAQHMTDADLRAQVRAVGRAIKIGGLFSLHLAGSRIPGEDNMTGDIPDGFDGRMCRSPEYGVVLLGDELGPQFTIKLLNPQVEFPQFKSYWYFVHARRSA